MRGAGQGQVFEIGRKRVADRGLHRVGALIGLLNEDVGDVIDHIDIAASAARHPVSAQPTVQNIASGVACQVIVLGVAGAIDRGNSGQQQVFKISLQGIGNGALDEIVTVVQRLAENVTGVVDNIDVVTPLAGQGVRARAAIQEIVASAAQQDIVAGQTIQVVVAVEARNLVVQTGAKQVSVVEISARRDRHFFSQVRPTATERASARRLFHFFRHKIAYDPALRAQETCAFCVLRRR